jgi:hypothetical protein
LGLIAAEKEVAMSFPDKFTVEYRKLDDFILPIVLNVCHPRSKDDSTEFFDAHCPSCGKILNAEGIAHSASLISVGQGASGCLNCGSSTLVVTLKGLTDEDKERLRKDKFFSKVLKAHGSQRSQASGDTNSRDGCFIATACYGSSRCHEVEVLRSFRDQALITNKIGSVIVGLYYTYSPPIASFFSRHIFLSKIVRTSVLNPIVFLARWCFRCSNKNGPKFQQRKENAVTGKYTKEGYHKPLD